MKLLSRFLALILNVTSMLLVPHWPHLAYAVLMLAYLLLVLGLGPWKLEG